MEMWKKVLIGTVSAVTLVGGASLGISAASARPDARPVEVRHEAEVRHEIQPADDHGMREQEARGPEAEGENEAGDDNALDEGQEDSNQGPDRGPNDMRNDDGPGHNRNDDSGRDR
jgi:hypothetical protein